MCLDNDRCTQVQYAGKEYGLCAYKGDNSLNDARARGLLSSMNQT